MSSCFSFIKSEAYDISMAIDAALQNNQKIAAAKEKVSASSGRENMALATLLPTANWGYSISTVKDAKTFTGQKVERNISENASLQISCNIFKSGADMMDIVSSNADKNADTYMFYDTVTKVTAQVILSYEKVLHDKDVVVIRQRQKRYYEDALDKAKVKFSLGVIASSDLAEAEYQMANAVSQLTAAEESLKEEKGKFRYLTGTEFPDEHIKLSHVDFHNVSMPASLDAVIDVTMQHNDAIMQSSFSYKREKAHSVAALSRLGASVDVSYNIAPDTSQSVYDSETSAYLFGGKTLSLNVRVPIFVPVDYARIYAQNSEKNRTKIAWRDAKAVAIEEAKKLWGRMESNVVLMKAREAALMHRVKLAKDTAIEYEVGTKNFTDSMRAQVDAYEAEIAFYDSVFYYTSSIVEMLGNMGTLKYLSPKILIGKEWTQPTGYGDDA
ncbi:Putative TolC-like protein [Candidatus Fokinia solitaria]|uniref:TolC-like protein n=1 Tax=Candidatus Fokinia solitaria TaxID=1802984 RepID=A0A2U8BT55_9RICK|nr:TolC family protein [Candidatus Fokinia solitaria]AWD33495.1 Putative TolC-like protein [Candidatus Fokinia solitaria]